MDNMTDAEVSEWLKTTKYKGKVGLTIKFYVQPDKHEELGGALMAMEEAMKAKNVNPKSDMYDDPKDENACYLVEEWASVDDLRTHNFDPDLQPLHQAVEACLKEPYAQIALFTEVKM